MPPKSSVTGQPHASDWFWNLLGLYDRQARPLASYYDDNGVGDFDPNDVEQRRVNDLFGLQMPMDRQQRARVYEEMDAYGLVSAILDVYAEESTQRDYDRGVSVWIESKASHMVEAGKDCLHNCQVEDRIAPIVRRYCKQGDAFQRLLYQTGKGVLGWKPTQSPLVERLEDKYSRLIGFKERDQKYRQGQRDVSWPWDYIHFRLLGKDEVSGYGTSILESLFQPWRRMVLTEDAILMYRLRRVPDRNLIMVHTGTMSPADEAAYLNAFKKKLRKNEIVDPASPNYRKQYNPLTPFEDIFLPIGKEREHRVETLSGAGNIGEIYDLEHFRDVFFGAAKVPKAYFGFEGDINAKATLAQQDVRFARTAKRIQRAALFGLRQLTDVHFTLLAGSAGEAKDKYNIYDPSNAYIVQMSPIAYLDEFERLELIQLRYQIVEAMSRLASDMQLDPRVWATYVLLNYAKLPEEMVLKLIKKTPDTIPPPTAAGPGFEALDPKMKQLILERDQNRKFIPNQGFFELNEAEQVAIARCVHESPALRRCIANWAEYGDYDKELTLVEAGSLQTDRSLVPPTIRHTTLRDTSVDGAEAKQLLEDLQALRPLTNTRAFH